MIIIDLSHSIKPGMPTYPGDETDRNRTTHTVAADGFGGYRLDMGNHVGTHVDCPAHMLADGATVDAMTPEHFCGTAIVLDVSEVRGEITPAHLEIDGSTPVDFVLLHTGNASNWRDGNYFQLGPFLSKEAATHLAALDLKGIGMDSASPDAVGSEYAAHKILFSAGMCIIENLCNLDQLPAQPFELICLPLKIESGDGAPVRAVAVLK